MGSIKEFSRNQTTQGLIVDAPMTLSALESAIFRARTRWNQQHPNQEYSADTFLVTPSDSGIAISWTDMEEN